jgi:glycogen synthase
LREKEYAEGLGKAAMKHVKKYFSAEKQAASYNELYRELLGRPKEETGT